MPRAQILAGRTFRPAEQRAGRRSSASGTKLTIRVVDRNIAVGGITDIALASVTWASRLCAAVGLLSHYPRPPRLPCATGIVNYSAHSRVIGSAEMDDRKYLTAEEVAQRYRGAVSVGTLRNWRAMRVGPAFVKIGKAVLYPVDELDAWDRRNMVSCRASKPLTKTESDRA